MSDTNNVKKAQDDKAEAETKSHNNRKQTVNVLATVSITVTTVILLFVIPGAIWEHPARLFWGLFYGGAMVFVGKTIYDRLKASKKNTRGLQWYGLGLMSFGAVFMITIILTSGIGWLTKSVVRDIDGGLACATDSRLEGCTEWQAEKAEKRAASSIHRPSPTQSTVATVTTPPPPAPPARKETTVKTCEPPEATLGCRDLVFYNWGTSWQMLVEERGVCPMIDPGGLFDAEWVEGTALIEFQLKPSLQTQEAKAGHQFKSYPATVILVPPGVKYKGELCPPLVD